MPIGWVAVGDPVQILPPHDPERIWAIQELLNFPRTVFGLERPSAGETIMPELTRRYARALGRHRDDRVVEPWPAGEASAVSRGTRSAIAAATGTGDYGARPWGYRRAVPAGGLTRMVHPASLGSILAPYPQPLGHL